MLPGGEVLTIAQMARADAAAIAGGIAGIELMENAGAAVSEAILARHPPVPTDRAVRPRQQRRRWLRRRPPAGAGRLAGPGRAARASASACAAMPPAAARAPGAATSARSRPRVLEGAGLVVDALFGAGLTRPLDGAARAIDRGVRAGAAAGRRDRRAFRRARRHRRGPGGGRPGPHDGHLSSRQARAPPAARARAASASWWSPTSASPTA